MEKLEKIAVLDDAVQMTRLAGILQARRIPHVMKSYHDSALDGLFQETQGWGCVSAPARWRREIVAILRDLSGKGDLAGGEE